MIRDVHMLRAAAPKNGPQPVGLMDQSDDDHWAMQVLADSSVAELLDNCSWAAQLLEETRTKLARSCGKEK